MYRHVQQPAAVVEVFAGVWPMLQAALGLYSHEPRPAERLCKVVLCGWLPAYAPKG